MKQITLLLLLAMGSANALAHGGADPLNDLEKNQKTVRQMQSEFERLDDRDERIDNLERQIALLQRNLLILRNLLASDFPHVKENMSKYKLDYMQAVDENLVALKSLAQQFKQALP